MVSLNNLIAIARSGAAAPARIGKDSAGHVDKMIVPPMVTPLPSVPCAPGKSCHPCFLQAKETALQLSALILVLQAQSIDIVLLC